MSHYRSKIKYSDFTDIWVYATDVFFNKYPEYTLSCGTYKASFHLSDRRIIRALSSFYQKNIGVTTTTINYAPQYFLTDVEAFQRIYILWINRYYPYNRVGESRSRLYFRYTTDRNVTINDYRDSHWFVINEDVYTPKDYVIHGVQITLTDNSVLRIHTSPKIDIRINWD